MNRLDVKRVQVREELAAAQFGHSSPLEVCQFMTPAPDCISGETSALELIRKFHQKEFRHLLVVDQSGRLEGVISDRDVIRCLGPDSPQRSMLAEIKASQLMSTDLVTVLPGTTLNRAVTLMVDHGISCLPVLADEKLVGILTNTDLYLVLEALAQSSPAVIAEHSA